MDANGGAVIDRARYGVKMKREKRAREQSGESGGRMKTHCSLLIR